MVTYDWVRTDVVDGIENVEKRLDKLRTMKILASPIHTCSVCTPNLDGHMMQYTMKECKSVRVETMVVNLALKSRSRIIYIQINMYSMVMEPT